MTATSTDARPAIGGSIEMISDDAVCGWIVIPEAAAGARPARPVLTIRCGKAVIFQSRIRGRLKREAERPGMLGIRFGMKLSQSTHAGGDGTDGASPAPDGELVATVRVGESETRIGIARLSILQQEYRSLLRAEQDALAEKYAPALAASGPAFNLGMATPHAAGKKLKKLCVISYATGPGAWFPYFYRHYAEIAGAENIYIISQAPELFAGMTLGGVISVSGQNFKDGARSELMSHLCSGLQAFYEWCLVCDVDEIVIPNPLGGLSFFDELDRAEGDVLLSRGLNVLQLPGEQDFDFDQPILGQRSIAEPLPRMCKHHLARTAVCFGGGFHFCSAHGGFAGPRSGFLNLHLKHASDRIYVDAARQVTALSCDAQGTRDYFTTVANKASFGRALRRESVDPREICVALDSERMAEYEQALEDATYYNPNAGMYGMAYGFTTKERLSLFVDLLGQAGSRPPAAAPADGRGRDGGMGEEREDEA